MKLATSNLVHKFGLGLAYQKTMFQTKIGRVLGRGASKKNWDPLLISATVEASNFKFGTQLGFGTSLPKNNVLDQNWRRSKPMQHRKKFATPYVFLQLLKLGTSNLVHKLGLGLATKNNVSDQNWRGSEHPKKIWDPLLIYATVEANIKFSTQIWFGTSLPKNDV